MKEFQNPLIMLSGGSVPGSNTCDAGGGYDNTCANGGGSTNTCNSGGGIRNTCSPGSDAPAAYSD